ncbi:MAG TPA: tetratricopeptide repeat protein [Candidatus Krumholzibacterium sp.]|nr:tetratricopeptide repeat protein [Candidatus Krumholzibacterium sp.]
MDGFTMRSTFIFAALLAICLAPPAVASTEVDPDATGFYMKGSFYEHSNDLQRAYTYYFRAHQLDPDNAEIMFALARVAFDMGKLEEARSYASKITGSETVGSRGTLILAEIEYRMDEKEKAAQLFEKVKDADKVPKLEVHKFLARIYLELEKVDRARSTLEAARDIFALDFYVNYRLGFIYADAGETDKAIASFRSAVQSNPSVPNAHLALASILVHTGEREEAKESFRQAISLDPANRTPIMDLTDLYYEDGEYEQAAGLLEPLLLSGDLDEAGKIQLGRTYYRLGRLEDALGAFRGVLLTVDDNPSILRVIAEIELEVGKLADAEKSLRRLIEVEPGNFNNYIGMLLVSFGLAGEPAEPGQAATVSAAEGRYFLKEAVKVHDGGSPEHNYILGAVYRKSGDLERALYFLLEAERLGADDRQTILELASLMEDMGDYAEALERVKLLHQADPEDASISNFYGYLLAQEGVELDLAESLLGAALEKEPDNGYYLDSLGWIKYRKGEYQEALGIFLKAVAQVENDAVIWEHLGDTYLKLSLFQEAEEAYSRSLGIDSEKPVVHGKFNKAKKALLDDDL